MAALRVALDLTTLPNGAEDGREAFQVRFVEALIRHLPEVEFVVLSRPAGQQALARLDVTNARRWTVPDPNLVESVVARLDARLPGRSRRGRLTRRLGSLSGVRRALARVRPSTLARLRATVLFCPFTTSTIDEPTVPVVAAICDLQHRSHPYLLGSVERAERERAFVGTYRRAARIVCSTPSVRDVALQGDGLHADRVLSLAPGRLLTAPPRAQPAIAATLARHALTDNDFVLFAADFEPQHNHRLLLTAWSIYRARHPDSHLRLVSVGGPAVTRGNLAAIASQMGLGTSARFLGPLDRDEISALIQASRAVIDPSLYETVGESVLEAMQLGRPVLCSRIPDLVELTGGAALTFDPHRAADLVASFERIEHEPGLLGDLAARGQKWVATLDSPTSVAAAYSDVFGEARTACPASR